MTITYWYESVKIDDLKVDVLQQQMTYVKGGWHKHWEDKGKPTKIAQEHIVDINRCIATKWRIADADRFAHGGEWIGQRPNQVTSF